MCPQGLSFAPVTTTAQVFAKSMSAGHANKISPSYAIGRHDTPVLADVGMGSISNQMSTSAFRLVIRDR
jgi:hypothetical protein